MAGVPEEALAKGVLPVPLLAQGGTPELTVPIYGFLSGRPGIPVGCRATNKERCPAWARDCERPDRASSRETPLGKQLERFTPAACLQGNTGYPAHFHAAGISCLPSCPTFQRSR